MPYDRVFIGAQVPRETARLLDEIREALQVRRPDTVVSRSDALRHCIHSLSGIAAPSDPMKSLKLDDDESGTDQKKG